jgi:signal transduction histidine kinase
MNRAGPDRGAAAPAGGRAPSRAALATLAGLGSLTVVVAEWVSLRVYELGDDPPLLVAIHDALPGVVFLAAGLLAWRARPQSRTGPWMVLTALLLFVGNFGNGSVPVVHQLAYGFHDLYFLPLGIVVVSFPTGRLRRGVESWLARIALAWLVFVAIITVISLNPARCPPAITCPANPFLLVPDVGSLEAIVTIRNIGGQVVWLAFVLVVARRWWSSTSAARRALVPVWFSGVAIAISGVASSALAELGAYDIADAFDGWFNWGISMLIPVVLLIGLIRGRLDQAAIGDLIEELAGTRHSSEQLRAALARAVGDPTLELAFPVGDEYVDPEGRPVTLPPTGAPRRATPVERDGETLAMIVHDRALDANPGLVRSAGAAAAMALENERLTAEVRARLVAVGASRARLVEAADAERARIERNLHDGAQQRLVTLAIRLRTLADASTDEVVTARLEALGLELDGALAELRELARGIHPAVLAQSGLASALQALADRSPIDVHVQAPATRFRDSIEAAAYYVAAEAVTNAVRHGHARHVTIGVVADTQLIVTIADDGVGGADPRAGTGLLGLEDRVAALGGSLTLTSSPGAGTRLRAAFPLGPHVAAVTEAAVP